jgi:hypothetical protein
LAVSHYYETIVRFGGGESSAAWPNWSIQDPLASLCSVAFGDYGTEAPGPRFRRAFEFLRADEIRIEEDVPTELLNRVTPIGFTADRLARPPRWLSGHGLVLLDPSDPEMLAAFWNLRSLGLSVAPWPLDDGGKFAAYSLEHLKRVIPSPGESGEIVGPYLWRNEWPRPHPIPDAIRAVLDEVDARPTVAVVDDRTWSQPTTKAEVWSSQSRGVLAVVDDDRSGKSQMAFALPPHPYAAASTGPMWLPHWIVDVSKTSEYDTPGYTLRLPRLPDLNRWATEALSPIDGARLNGSAVGIFSQPDATTIRFRLPEEADVVRQVLARAEITAETSSAGEAVTRILQQMGGLAYSRVFRLPGVRKLLARSPSPGNWSNVLAAIEDAGTFRKYGNTHGTAADVFRRLLDKGVFRAGLHVHCPACNIRSRYAPENLATEIACARCGSAFLLARRLEDAQWKYQASGFFEHHREHGAIPVILAMLRLENDLRGRALFLVAGQTMAGDGVNCEADLIALEQRHDGEVAVALGECKGGPKKITQEGFDKLVAAADKVRASGLECYLVFATTRDEFAEDELAIFRGYRERIRDDWSLDEGRQGWRRPAPILFTARELQNFWAYEGPIREMLPEEHAMSLRQLAANSAFVYLDEHAEALPRDEPDRLMI